MYIYADDGQNKTEKAFSPNVYHVGASDWLLNKWQIFQVHKNWLTKHWQLTDDRLMTALHMSENLLLLHNWKVDFSHNDYKQHNIKQQGTTKKHQSQ